MSLLLVITLLFEVGCFFQHSSPAGGRDRSPVHMATKEAYPRLTLAHVPQGGITLGPEQGEPGTRVLGMNHETSGCTPD
jgi:hypothetical protein